LQAQKLHLFLLEPIQDFLFRSSFYQSDLLSLSKKKKISEILSENGVFLPKCQQKFAFLTKTLLCLFLQISPVDYQGRFPRPRRHSGKNHEISDLPVE